MVGCLAGFFGVGGGFLMTPLLNVLFNIPYNVAIGSSLAQILGLSLSATLKHRQLGQVDGKLGLLLIIGTLPGVEVGTHIIEVLKRTGTISVVGREIAALDLFVPLAYILLLLSVGLLIMWESRAAQKRPPRGGKVETKAVRWMQSVSFPPLTALRESRIERISVPILCILGFLAGLLVGFMGVGGGFILTPALIYIVGVPTTVAIGTNLFRVIFAAGFGCFIHTLKGNVDLLLVVVPLCGGSLGAQVGALLTPKFRGARIRYYFSLLTFLAVAVVAWKLLHKLGVM